MNRILEQIFIIIIIIIITRRKSGLDIPVSVSSVNLFNDLQSRFRPFGLKIFVLQKEIISETCQSVDIAWCDIWNLQPCTLQY
jgi:hypothetical protein